MRKKIWGFTLVELLVVIAIIAMLLAIMVPILARSRLLGSRITCLYNLKQLGVAVEAYTQSYKYYPVCVQEINVRWSDFLKDNSIAKNTELGVPVSLWPFYLNANLYNCPVLTKAGADISYCYNASSGEKTKIEVSGVQPSYIPPPKEYESKYILLRPQDVKQAAMYILLYDLPTGPPQITDSLFKDIDPNEKITDANSAGYMANAGPHNNGYNLLFSDGHSKWHKRWDKSSMTRNPK